MSRKNEIRTSLKGLGSNIKNMKGNPRGPVSKNLKVEPRAFLYPKGKGRSEPLPFTTTGKGPNVGRANPTGPTEFHPIAIKPANGPEVVIGAPVKAPKAPKVQSRRFRRRGY